MFRGATQSYIRRRRWVPSKVAQADASVTAVPMAAVADVVVPAITPGVPDVTALDDFNRSDATDLGANWTTTDTIETATPPRVIGNQASTIANGTPGSAYWNQGQCQTYLRAMFNITARPNANDDTAGTYSGVGFLSSPGSGAVAGYVVKIRYEDTLGADYVSIYRHDNSSTRTRLTLTSLGGRITPGSAVLEIRVYGGAVYALLNGVVVDSFADSTYFNAGQSAFPVMQVGDFGASGGSTQSLIRHDNFSANTVSVSQTVSPGPAGGVADVVTPSVNADQTVTAVPAAAVADIAIPTSVISETVTPGPMSTVGGFAVPGVTGTGDATVVATTMGSLADVPSPADNASATVSSVAAGSAADLVVPGVGAGASESPGAEGSSGDVPVPGVGGTATVSPGAMGASAGMGAAALSIGQSVSPGAGHGAGDVFVPVVNDAGRVIPRIDLPTVVTLDQQTTTTTLRGYEADMVVDASPDAITLDQETAVVVLDG